MKLLQSLKGWDSTRTAKNGRMKMSDDGTKVTIRMGPEEIQMMEDFMADQDIGNRSDFIRDAIKGYIASVKAGQPMNAEGGIFVRLNDVQMDTLEALVQTGIAVSPEEYIRKCLLEKIVPKSIEDDAIENAFKAAQMKAALK
jgi:Arc/MetJ-type ribon-helix-helix transcriptional regulator